VCINTKSFGFLEIYVGQFNQNPYVRGSYSNAVVGATFADFDNLQGRLGGLFFAGEATDVDYWGYMQGAYLTALKQAKMIVSCLNGKECPEYEPKDDDICKTIQTTLFPALEMLQYLL
jgi:polyamine oxidase